MAGRALEFGPKKRGTTPLPVIVLAPPAERAEMILIPADAPAHTGSATVYEAGFAPRLMISAVRLLVSPAPPCLGVERQYIHDGLAPRHHRVVNHSPFQDPGVKLTVLMPRQQIIVIGGEQG